MGGVDIVLDAEGEAGLMRMGQTNTFMYGLRDEHVDEMGRDALLLSVFVLFSFALVCIYIARLIEIVDILEIILALPDLHSPSAFLIVYQRNK